MSATVLPFARAVHASFQFTREEVDQIHAFHFTMNGRKLISDSSQVFSSDKPSLYYGFLNVNGQVFSSVMIAKNVVGRANEYIIELNQQEAFRSRHFKEALDFMYDEYNKVELPASYMPPRKIPNHWQVIRS